MFKRLISNVHFRIGAIIGLFVVCAFAVLPKTPVSFDNQLLKIDTNIGGYVFKLTDDFLIDLSGFKYGLDLEGGVRIVLKADMSKIPNSEKSKAVDSAIGIIERRINFLGVSEPSIVPAKSGEEQRIIVEIPGVADVTEAVALIGQTAQLKFKVLKPDLEWNPEKAQEYAFDPESWDETDISGADLRGVDVVFSTDQNAPQGQPQVPQIQLKFSNEGRKKFEELAKQNIGKPVALFLDDSTIPISMPIVDASIAEGLTSDPVINGTFDYKTAKALSIQLRAGALPVPVEVLQQETIGATLGEESINKSMKAGVIGLVIVLVFMILVYGRLGFFADFALVLYALIVLTIFKIVPVVLTLPGIAGFLLSTGMAVDANILIFERIREELAWGKPKSLAIKFGFERAWTSIRDSNVASLITASILFYFGTGQVRGFALTLAIGILVSMFTAIVVTRTLIEFVSVRPVTSGRKKARKSRKLKIKRPNIRKVKVLKKKK